MDQPEFKAGKRGPKLALQPIDIWVLKYALTEAVNTGADELTTLRKVVRHFEQKGILNAGGDRTTNRKRLERLHKEIGGMIRPIARAEYSKRMAAALMKPVTALTGT